MRLRQAAADLLDNAVKFTPRGIPEEDLPRVWERLFRGDRARSQKGLGLGPSLVRAVAVAHGGRVGAANRPEGGAALHEPKHAEVFEGARWNMCCYGT